MVTNPTIIKQGGGETDAELLVTATSLTTAKQLLEASNFELKVGEGVFFFAVGENSFSSQSSNSFVSVILIRLTKTITIGSMKQGSRGVPPSNVYRNATENLSLANNVNAVSVSFDENDILTTLGFSNGIASGNSIYFKKFKCDIMSIVNSEVQQ